MFKLKSDVFGGQKHLGYTFDYYDETF